MKHEQEHDNDLRDTLHIHQPLMTWGVAVALSASLQLASFSRGGRGGVGVIGWEFSHVTVGWARGGGLALGQRSS